MCTLKNKTNLSGTYHVKQINKSLETQKIVFWVIKIMKYIYIYKSRERKSTKHKMCQRKNNNKEKRNNITNKQKEHNHYPFHCCLRGNNTKYSECSAVWFSFHIFSLHNSLYFYFFYLEKNPSKKETNPITCQNAIHACC